MVDHPATYGVGTIFLDGVRGARSEWSSPGKYDALIRAFDAQLLLHNCARDNAGGNGSFLKMLAEENPEFILYTENKSISSLTAGVFVSLYRFKHKTIAIVVNQNRTVANAELMIDWEKLNLSGNGTKIINLETGQLLNASRNKMTISIPARNYLLIMFASSGD